MARPGLTAAGLSLLLLTACGSDPHADEVEPQMRRAVQAVLDATGPGSVERALLPRCGPTDEALGGLQLSLLAETATRSGVDAAARALRAQELDVTVGSGDGAPLIAARPEDGQWTLEVQRSDREGLVVQAVAQVDDASATPQRPLTGACG